MKTKQKNLTWSRIIHADHIIGINSNRGFGRLFEALQLFWRIGGGALGVDLKMFSGLGGQGQGWGCAWLGGEGTHSSLLSCQASDRSRCSVLPQPLANLHCAVSKKYQPAVVVATSPISSFDFYLVWWEMVWWEIYTWARLEMVSDLHPARKGFHIPQAQVPLMLTWCDDFKAAGNPAKEKRTPPL